MSYLKVIPPQEQGSITKKADQQIEETDGSREVEEIRKEL